jgi:hypothetical protein
MAVDPEAEVEAEAEAVAEADAEAEKCQGGNMTITDYGRGWKLQHNKGRFGM